MTKILLTILAILATVFGVFYFTKQEVRGFAPQYGISEGLVGHWSMDTRHTNWTSATAATTVDMSGNGNHGTLVNVTRSTFPVIGKIGQGFRFDGVNDSMTAGSPAILSPDTGDFSVSIWLNLSALPAGNDTLIADTDAVSTDSYYIITSTSNRFQCAFKDGATTVQITDAMDALVPTVGKWTHYVCIRQGTNVYFYRNGSLIGSSSNAGLVDVSTEGSWNFTLGSAVTGGASSIPGTIDDVRIYNRALSATEVRQLYRLGLTEGAR